MPLCVYMRCVEGMGKQKKGFTQPSPKDGAGKCVSGRSGPRRSPCFEGPSRCLATTRGQTRLKYTEDAQ